MTAKRIKPRNWREPFKSKTEENFFDDNQAFELWLGSSIAKIVYEPFILTLYTGEKTLKYTPDFYVMTEDNQILFVEVKASRRAKDFYYTRARLQACSIKFPEFGWVIAIQKSRSKTEWTFEEF
jgi:hypothetical protein